MQIQNVKRECLIQDKRVKLSHIDGLGDFNKSLLGVVISQQDKNNCKIKLDEKLIYKNAEAQELIVTARHRGYDLNKILVGGIRKIFNIPPIIAVNVYDSNNKIGFRAEIFVEIPG